MNPQTAQQLAITDIFSLLGIEGTTDEDREAFLNQLQDAIWEEVVEDELLETMTDEEVDSIEQTIVNEEITADEKRNTLFGMLSSKVPNLEEKLAETTNRLKYELLGERVDGLREFYAENAEQLGVLDQAEQLIETGKVAEAISLLNKQQAENTSA